MSRLLAVTVRRRVYILSLAVAALLFFLFFSGYNLKTNTNPLSFDSPPPFEAGLSDGPTTNDAPTTPPARILLVSALFPLSKSKHSMHEYTQWLTNFLQPITTDIYFFTTPDLLPLVQKIRGDLPITINTTFSSPFEIPPLVGLEGRYEEMHGMDREKRIHSPALYAVWNAKPYFLDEGLKNSGKVYDYAFWNDAGSFRSEHKYVRWPDSRVVDRIWEEGSVLSGTPKEDLLFFPMYSTPHASMQYWQESMGPVDNEFSEGSFFGGSRSTISWWRSIFYTYHNTYLSAHLFVGKDQTLINALLLLHPHRIITVWLDDPLAPAHQGLLPPFDSGALGSCGQEWFYYQFWLAAPEERGEMRKVWDLRARWNWDWWNWDWWRARQSCRVTRVLAMRDVLGRVFGEGWRPPRKSISVGA